MRRTSPHPHLMCFLGCVEVIFSQGLCHKHYDQMRRSSSAGQKYTYEYNRSESYKDSHKNYTLKNIDKVKEYKARFRETAAYKEMRARYAHSDAGRKMKRMHCARRRSLKLKATPAWADLEEIRKIYKSVPDGFQVDHIIPLKGKNVCGLHVSWNLQYLTPSENYRKNNRVVDA